MPKKLSFPQNIDAWEVLFTNLTTHLEQIPTLTPDHEALRALVAEGRALESVQEVQKSELRMTNQQRVDLQKRGRDVRNRVVFMLKAVFGQESEDLVRFGVKPRARELRRKVLSPAEKAQQLSEEAARMTETAAAKAAIQTATKTLR